MTLLSAALAALAACTPAATVGIVDDPDAERAEIDPGQWGDEAAPPPTPSGTPRPPPTPSPTAPWARPYVDLHVDTISRVRLEGLDLWGDPQLEASLDRLDAAGVGLIVEAVWVPGSNKTQDPHGWAVEGVRALRRALDAQPERWSLVGDADDLAALKASGGLGAVLSLEGGHALRTADDVALFADLGVRMIGLTWSFSGPLCGSSGDRPSPGLGLSPLGREVVGEMNRLGLAIDVSHASDACIDDVLALSDAPILASHTNARSLRDVPRNLDDDRLQRIAQGGGIVGVMFHAPFVAASPDVGSVADQVMRLGAVMGFEHVAVGSDFDGWIEKPRGLATEEDLPALAAALADRGLTDAEIRGVLGMNARAYFERLWQASPRGSSSP